MGWRGGDRDQGKIKGVCKRKEEGRKETMGERSCGVRTKGGRDLLHLDTCSHHST